MHTSICACTRRWSQPFRGLGLPSGSLRHLQALASHGRRAEPAPGRPRVWGWWEPHLDVPWQQEARHLAGVTASPLSLGSSRKVGALTGGSSEAGHSREAGARGSDCPHPRGERLLGRVSPGGSMGTVTGWEPGARSPAHAEFLFGASHLFLSYVILCAQGEGNLSRTGMSGGKEVSSPSPPGQGPSAVAPL